MELISQHKAFGGRVAFYSHASAVNNCDMRFSIFLPRLEKTQQAPLLTYLAGLTCTEETFMIKAGAQRLAAELGLALLAPDTSPRGEDVPDDPEGAYDFGLGAGFYLNAIREPWSRHYRMYDYITSELPALVAEHFPVAPDRQGIFGHSMGGHGALTIGLRNPQTYASISAFAPICNPVNCPWGQKAFENYLGEDRSLWQTYDASYVAATTEVKPANTILVDQGLADQFLEQELHPYALETACESSSVPLKLRRHLGYDHGYYFIATYIEDHLRHHAAALTG